MFGDPTVTFFGALFVVVKYIAFFSAVIGVLVAAFCVWVCVFWAKEIASKWLDGVGERAAERARRLGKG